jgi:hypothetical protein
MRTSIFTFGSKKMVSRTNLALPGQDETVPDRSQARWTALLLLGLTLSSQAAENETNGQSDNLVPDLELLEFLGSFQTEDGDYMDPGMMLNDEFVELLDLAARMDDAAGNTESNTEEDEQGNQ